MILAFFILSLRFPSREVFQVHYSIFQIWLSSIEVRLSTCWSTQVFLFSYFLFAVFSLHVICFALCVYACVSFSLFPPTHSYFSLTLWSLSLTLSFSLFLSVCFLSSHFSFPLSRSLPSYLSISISFPLPLYFGLVHSFIHTLSLSLSSLSHSLFLSFFPLLVSLCLISNLLFYHLKAHCTVFLPELLDTRWSPFLVLVLKLQLLKPWGYFRCFFHTFIFILIFRVFFNSVTRNQVFE